VTARHRRREDGECFKGLWITTIEEAKLERRKEEREILRCGDAIDIGRNSCQDLVAKTRLSFI
jgi:hypothetical protein